MANLKPHVISPADSVDTRVIKLNRNFNDLFSILSKDAKIDVAIESAINGPLKVLAADGSSTIPVSLRGAPRDFGLELARGNIPGMSYVHKFGTAIDFDTVDNEVDVWDGSNDAAAWAKYVYNYSSTADITRISSSSAGDTQVIEIQGLDSNWALTVQNVTLNGQSKVVLGTALRRIFRMKNEGSTDLAGTVFCYVDGAITAGVPNSTAGTRAIIRGVNNQTEMAIYTIPLGKTGYLGSWYASSAGASKTTNYRIKMKMRQAGGVFQLKHKMAWDGGTPYQHNYHIDEGGLPEKTDIIMTAQALASGVTQAAISAGFDIILVDN